MTVGDGTISKVHDSSFSTRRITSFVWMPMLFTVVTEKSITSGALTLDFGTARTFCSYHCIAVNERMFRNKNTVESVITSQLIIHEISELFK